MNRFLPEALHVEQASLRKHQEMHAWGVLTTLWRRRWLILGFAAAGLLVGILLLRGRTPQFNSEAVLRLELSEAKPSALAQMQRSFAEDSKAAVESEARVIDSLSTARRVVSRLRLDQDPSFIPRVGRLEKLLLWISPTNVSGGVELSNLIATQLLNRLSVKNDEQSYIVKISYTSRDPDKAALIANAFMDEYLQTRIEASMAEIKPVQAWLASQIAEKRAALMLSERAFIAAANEIDLKTREARTANLQAQAAALRDELKTLNENYQYARAFVELKPAPARVVTRAQPASSPADDNRLALTAIPIAAATALGIALALVLERRDTGFRTNAEVPATLGLRCLGAIPEVRKASIAKERPILQAAIREALTDNLSVSAASKIIIVTSSLPGEGKTFFTRELGLLLANYGCRTLVIDATPQPAEKSIMHEGEHSLDELLANERLRARLFSDLPRESVTNVRRTSGLSNGQILFGTAAFKEFLQDARRHYDFVLLEAPPVLLLTDFWISHVVADLTILVVRWNSTPRAMVEAALLRLADLSVLATGVLLSRVVLKRHGTYHFSDQISFLRKYRSFYKAGL
jgi:Mrp family chromosome partitioning ATPase